MTEQVGLLVMAYGTASGPDDVERYYTDIRGGRPPSPEALEDLKARYAAIGNRFPLLEITRRQSEGLAATLSEDGGPEFRPYLGMKHSPPFIQEAVERMRDDRIERAVGIVMAPHWSGMSVQTYGERVEKAADAGGPTFTFVRHWHDHPRVVDFLSGRVSAALDSLGPEAWARAGVIFSAHSLPVRYEGDREMCLRCSLCEDECRYDRQLHETARSVGERLGLGQVQVAWQSAGHTADPWRGPTVQDAIRDAASRGNPAVVVCSAGFVADHLEILYDLDIEARQVAESVGVAFARTEMPNDDPEFIEAVAAVIRDHLAEGATG